ncbi:MAG: SIS domain-containing protein [Candidatus Omnitrophica bacterium]|nr:SIS domain-containing protein [Candidatus Omnitrophota bacterium]
MREAIQAGLRETARTHTKLAAESVDLIAQAAAMMTEAIRAGRKIIWCGNGGSATQSQHMAAEFVGRFCKERRALPSISLTENMASVTAIANDYDYTRVFARQLEALGQPGDVVVGLSTSGNSPNVIACLEQAKALGLPTIGLTGGGGGKMRQTCELCIVVPSKATARIQEAHLTIGHILCGLVEDTILSDHTG